MSRTHTDLSTVQISAAPSPATSGTSLGVSDANAALLPDIYPWWGLLRPNKSKPTRSNSEIVKVTGGSSSGGTTTYTIVRAQGIPVTTAQAVDVGWDLSEVHTADKQNSNEDWKNPNETWEYVSVDDPTGVIKVHADVTTKYYEGMKIKFTNGGNVIKGIITKMGTYGGTESGYTYITFLHEIDPTDSLALYLMANSAITANYYSVATAPQGFPQDKTHWRIKVEDANNRTTTPTKDTWYNPNNLSLSVPIGRWKLGYFVGHRCAATTTGHYMSFVSLATSNNNAGDNEFKRMHGNNPGFSTGISYTLGISSAEKIVNLTAKTSYYLNHMCATAGTLTNECGFYGQWDVITTIYAECDYL